jgi:uncharacterized protein (DUF302 family)
MSATTILRGACFAAALAFCTLAQADNPTPYPGTVVLKSAHSYPVLVERLETAIGNNEMGLVARASATMGAKSLGLTIPGNQVIMVYHPKFAVRMLKAYVPAGFEAPIRYYVTENDDGTATLTYRTPSSVFGPYSNAAIDAMAAELDLIFATIAAEATRP